MSEKENRPLEKPVAPGSHPVTTEQLDEDPKVKPTQVNPPPKLPVPRRPAPGGSHG